MLDVVARLFELLIDFVLPPYGRRRQEDDPGLGDLLRQPPASEREEAFERSNPE